ncbi:MAG: hypothetical protein R2729_00960 [Bryobacteraceae bacterium]
MSRTIPKSPPRLLAALVAWLLPSERREPVLGDLEERFREGPPSRALPRYLFEAVTVVPAILYGQWRSWFAELGVPRPVRAGSRIATVRAQVQDFQREISWGLRFYSSVCALVSMRLAWTMFTVDRWLPRLVCLAFMAVFLFTLYQHHRRGSARVVPEGESLPDLFAFHQRELARRRDFLRTLWYWKIAPIALSTLSVLIVKRGVDSLPAALFTAGCFAFVKFAARCQAEGIQRRIDEVDALADFVGRTN